MAVIRKCSKIFIIFAVLSGLPKRYHFTSDFMDLKRTSIDFDFSTIASPLPVLGGIKKNLFL